MLSLIVTILRVIQDVVQASVRDYSFYLSESLLFNSFWLWFVPVLWLALRILPIDRQWAGLGWMVKVVLLIVAATGIHLLLYPIVVFIFSSLFLDHTFSYQRALWYAVSEYVYLCVAVYGLIAMIRYYPVAKPADENKSSKTAFLKNIPIKRGVKNSLVDVNDIVYIKAESPYIALHTAGSKVLLPESLSSIQEKLDPTVFVRVHRSTIINLHYISTYTSRGNGDYDLTLRDGTVIRMSRNYRSDFTEAMSRSSAKQANPSA